MNETNGVNIENDRSIEDFSKGVIKTSLLDNSDVLKDETQKGNTYYTQVLAALIINCYSIVCGMAITYSSILIPQLTKNQTDGNMSLKSEISITETDSAWIASIQPCVISLTSILFGLMVDKIGRLYAIKLSAIPMCAGWAVIALAQNAAMIKAGRMLVGLALSITVCGIMVYLAEISTPDIRGPITALHPVIATVGMWSLYIHGYFLHWRVVAWLIVLYAVVSIALIVVCLPESPVWLISKRRTHKARESLKWLFRFSEKEKIDDLVEEQLSILQNSHKLKVRIANSKQNSYLKRFIDPVVIKPLLILITLAFFQSFSGIYITLSYTVQFFEDVGAKMDPYLASIALGSTRVVMVLLSLYLMKTFGRRTLLLASALGMAVCMGISGYFTGNEGHSHNSWIPITMILLYTVSTTIGFLSIPFVLAGELFPLDVRGVAYNIVFGAFNLIMFLSIQMYYDLKRLFGGSSGLQYFFSIVSLGGFVYCYVFIPETRNLDLSEIESYFHHHTSYLSWKNTKRSK